MVFGLFLIFFLNNVLIVQLYKVRNLTSCSLWKLKFFFCLLKRDWRKETWSVTLQLVTKISFQSSKWKIAWKIHFELTTRFFLLCRGSQDLIKAIKHHLGVYTLKITVYVNEWAMEILEDSQIIVQQKKNKISIHTHSYKTWA